MHGEGIALVRRRYLEKIIVAVREQAYAIGKLSLETVAVDSTLIDSKKVVNLFGTTDIRDARSEGSCGC